jgi:hypothetical protein
VNDDVNHNDIGVFNNIEGYPVIIGDIITVRVYQKNESAKFNHKLVNVIVYGCSPDCVLEKAESVSVYEPCESDNVCVAKFTLPGQCNPALIDDPQVSEVTRVPSSVNPQINPQLPSGQSDALYVISQEEYVTLNGVRIYI